MIPIVRKVIDRMLGRSERMTSLRGSVDEVAKSRAELRHSVSRLGQDVWTLVETGDPLRALVHAAKHAEFARRIEEGNNE